MLLLIFIPHQLALGIACESLGGTSCLGAEFASSKASLTIVNGPDVNLVLLYYTAWSGSHWDYGPRCLGSCGIGHFCLGPAPQQVRRNPKSEKSTESEAPSQSIFDQYFDISGTICSGGSGCLRTPGMQWMRSPSGLRLSLPTSLSLSTQSETFTFPFYSKWKTEPADLTFLSTQSEIEPANFTFPFYSKWEWVSLPT